VGTRLWLPLGKKRILTPNPPHTQMFSTLYGQTAAALYAKAAGQNAQARQLYNASADTYYKANDAAAYDDWVRARNHWDYFYNRS